VIHAYTSLNGGSVAAKQSAGLVHYAVLWAAVSLSLWVAWTGFVASDDEYYAAAGVGWANHFPYVADYFATARTTVGIPIALVIRLFGESEFTIVLSTCLFFAATVSVTLSVLSRLIGAIPATVACLVMCTLPLFALKSTIPSADLPELFFVASSFWLFWLASQRVRRFWLLISAGVCAALAFSAHEVSAGLVLFYGVLFVLGFGMPRREYWIMAVGFIAIVMLESAYYAVFTGDPFHRFALLFPSGTVSGAIGDRVEVRFLQIAAGGTLHVSDYLDPLLMFFTHHDFALLGFAAAPALWWVFVTKSKDWSPPLATARLLAGLALVWFLFVAIELRASILISRYYMVTAYCLFVIVAIWASLAIWPRKPAWAAAGVALFVLADLTSISVDNKNPRFAERALVEYLGVSAGPVFTDPLTASDSTWFCRWAKMDCSRIKSGPPDLNQVYFYNPRNADHPTRLVPADQVRLYRISEQWKELWRKEEPSKSFAVAAQHLGITRMMPPVIRMKLDQPNPAVRVFQVTDIDPRDTNSSGNTLP